MFLYHGSNVTIEKPQMVIQTRGLDFGPGFYLTTDEKQAKRFSGVVFKRKQTGTATVNVYNFDMPTAEKTLSIQKFLYADSEWLEFVTENRLKTYSGSSNDMVIGAVANDTVMPTIQLFLNGFLNKEAALITLKVSKLVDQICLKTDKALSLLVFCDAYINNYQDNGNG